MSDVCTDDKFVSSFLLNTCQSGRRLTIEAILALDCYVQVHVGKLPASSDDDDVGLIAAKTGSVAEFYIRPMLSCVGDIDIMYYRNSTLAIPTGTAPPTQLPGEFHSRVVVFEIVDSEFPGYVYLVSSYLLTECINDDKYKAIECPRMYAHYKYDATDSTRHGPAFTASEDTGLTVWGQISGRLSGSYISNDDVYCLRCLSWPTQAAHWQSRHRNYGWPDSATIDHVVNNNGCDVVMVAHRRCRRDQWMNTRQFRLSFSRAEVVLLNCWIPVQQIVYHMLRVFVKVERLTENANNSDGATLSNYHIKTLMLWACELKPRSWWIDDLNLVRLCVELLHTLGDWLSDVRCPHYFIHNCNLLTYPDDWCCSLMQVASRLMSETAASLSEWFIAKMF